MSANGYELYGMDGEEITVDGKGIFCEMAEALAAATKASEERNGEPVEVWGYSMMSSASFHPYAIICMNPATHEGNDVYGKPTVAGPTPYSIFNMVRKGDSLWPNEDPKLTETES